MCAVVLYSHRALKRHHSKGIIVCVFLMVFTESAVSLMGISFTFVPHGFGLFPSTAKSG